jgi:hypothetical protein
MGIKPKESKSFKTPGPGEYQQDVKPVAKAMPAFSISGKLPS